MDYILLSKMKFYGHTGCLPEEKLNGQYFYITVKLGLNRIEGTDTDCLKDTVDYSQVFEICRKIVTDSDCNLIEYLAGRIAEKVLEFDSRIAFTEVSVSKPSAPIEGEFETMEITIVRRQEHRVYLSLGSNLGDKRENLKTAVDLIRSNPEISEVELSNVYETEPWGYKDQDSFYNICITCKTTYEPEELLKFTQGIEQNMRRVKTIVNGPRNIDVDILLFDNIKYASADLIIPHPRMYERAFVLVPLKELTEVSSPVPNNQGIKLLGIL